MSGLKDFLTPYSQLIFANRNIVIVILCFVAGGVAIVALMDRWRADRLERDLEASRSNASGAPQGRRYSPGGMVDAAPTETGGALPPVKGGRTYARNLGTALQKAGMSGPQVYSPPTPPGFAPQAGPMQPAMGQPGQARPYAPPSVPWATPATPPPGPWAFPGATGRPPAPTNAPFYQPQPAGGPPPSPLGPPSQQPPTFGPGPYAPPSGPGGFPPQPGPFAPPPFSAPNQPSAAAPAFTPPAAGPPMTPPMPLAPIVQPPAEAESGDGGRRGKPKRRRFNFNVLENLEKMVQSKPAEHVAGNAPAVPPPTPVPTASLGAPLAPPAAPAAAAPPTPSTPPAAAVPSAPAAPNLEAPSLPFFFGKRDDTNVAKPSEATPPSAPVPSAAPEPEPAMAEEPEAAASAPEETTTSTEVTEAPALLEQAPAPPEHKDDARRSMRSMMFGEEIVSAAAPAEQEMDAEPSETEPPVEAAGTSSTAVEGDETTAESADQPSAEPATAETTTDSESAWPSASWSRREEATASAEPEPNALEPVAESLLEAAHQHEPAMHGTPFGPYDPWKPAEAEPAAQTTDSWKSETEPEAEADAVAEPVAEAEHQEELTAPTADAPDAHGPETPAAEDGDKGAAGTLVIIEDDQTAASYYATLFRGNGYRVEVANDGVSGVDLCTRVQPQVILLDVMMPRQNGILVLQTLRASDETKSTPVVVMSNFSEPTLIKRAIQLGALEYVIKTQVEGPALLNAMPRWMNREKAFAAA